MIMSEKPSMNTAAACRAYFEVFLPGLRGELLMPGLRTLNCTLGVAIAEEAPVVWVLVVSEGRLHSVVPQVEEVQCVFHLDARTLLEVATGTLAPDKAFFDLKIEIEGDMAQGLQLSTVLEPFFKQFPFRWTGA